jgi:hypothetical protein
MLILFQRQNEEPTNGKEKVQHGSEERNWILDTGNDSQLCSK